MPEDWFVRVLGKEYGPVDLDTLLEWKAEGRLVPENEVRKESAADWIPAGTVEELFPPAEVVDAATAQLYHPRTIGQIIAETFSIYRRAFLTFFALALIVALPSLAMQLSLLFVDTRSTDVVSMTTRVASSGAILSFLTLLFAWPLFIGGMQFAVAEVAAGRAISLSAILTRAREVWRRIAKLCLFVYGTFLFWTALPLIAVLIVAASPSIPALLLALCALAFQVYMAGRLFVNFMFWQQASTLGQLEGVEALRDSKELARSRPEAPRLERPLYRGAILASLWLLLLIGLSFAIELPFLLVRLSQANNLEEAVALMQTLTKAPPVDALTVASYTLSSLMHAVVRPLLGIAFVVLYFDAKARVR